ncbi:MAG TPA: Crp/Fnr family transcriptional regulator [Rhizomicrobium sp.]|nr:Crp/Fnr family transcriptional regulator [Rhizomicrobium sp.]
MPALAKAQIQPILDRNVWFAGQPQTLKSALIAHGRIVEVERGQWVYGAGDELNGLYAVLDGSVQMMMSTFAQEDVLIDIAWSGQIFGQASQFGGGPRLVTALAGGRSTLLFIPDHALRDIARAQPSVWRNFASLFYAQLGGALMLAVNMIHLTPPARITARLLLLAGSSAGDGAELRITQSQIAELTGLTRKTVNFHLTQFAKRGIAEPAYGGIILRNIAEMRRIARG